MLAIAGCSEDNTHPKVSPVDEPSADAVTILATIDAIPSATGDGEAYAPLWQEGDQIVVGYKGISYVYETYDAGNGVEFHPMALSLPADARGEVTAYFKAVDGVFAVGADQTGATLPMYAYAADAAPAQGSLGLHFKPLASVLSLTIGEEASKTISKITLEPVDPDGVEGHLAVSEAVVDPRTGAVTVGEDAAGYYPPSSNRGTYAAASGDNPPGFSVTRCTANEFDVFSGGGVAAPYTEGTGLSAWGKSGNIAGRPGYVKMGAGSAAASLYTPELTALPDAATVKVRFSAQAYSEKYDGSGADAGKILVKAVRGAVLGAKGAITGTVTEVSAADPVDISAAKARFREFEATLTNVTPDCRIVISTSEKRALLDNVVVTCTAITPATKPAAPGGVSFDAAAAADRLTLKWNAVPDATSYTVAYWKGSASAPESEYAYKTGIASTATSQELTNLESNTSYWAKVKAVGSLDSDWSETANATTMDSGGEPLLPTADLLDVVFRNDGSAMDNSSSATPVRRMPSSRP